MEAGDEPIPANPRGWLSKQLAETLHDEKPVRSVTDLESRLPEMIERAVAERFQQMAGRLQQEIEEAHVRTLETFVKNIQVKLLQRVSALEQDMAKQADSMHQLRECSQRTEDNLSRLITGVDKLAQELPKRLQAPGAENVPSKAELAVGARANAEPRRSASNHTGVKVFWLAVAGVVMVGLVAWGSARIGHRDRTVPPAADEATSAPALPETGKPGPPPSNADTKTRLQAAEQYTGRKDYAMAEDIYKQIIRTEPDNVDALKALASVLYREDKIDESAAILDRIPK
jgi:tetratricopeptide (TPR) repeat protein